MLQRIVYDNIWLYLKVRKNKSYFFLLFPSFFYFQKKVAYLFFYFIVYINTNKNILRWSIRLVTLPPIYMCIITLYVCSDSPLQIWTQVTVILLYYFLFLFFLFVRVFSPSANLHSTRSKYIYLFIHLIIFCFNQY